ncbi:dual oxidase maturation factor 2-like [Uloborus diversus]|uniref:dual oxidase maturation factor 2-like n=1 Tax=Uloborus diversus TaxID=327109 RepID=UPI0024093372|nr:dual oxidase maturation factor 2-like [Uloborus diversus]
MLRGWFDAFRSDGGPTLYTFANRTPVTEDVRNVLIYVSFSTLFVAFLIVFPGIRKEKFSTFISVTISLFVGAVILISNYGTEWHVAQATISSPYRAFSKEKISANVGVKIGLNSVNITLQALAIHKRSEDINYNERFRWVGATEMKQEYRHALVKGLPFPLLTIAEYFTQELEGFCWGRRYRLAGYYSHILLWAAFSLWLLMNILLCTVPRYGAYTMQLTGTVMLLTNGIYTYLLPRKPLVIPFEGGALTFKFGWCFWIVLAAGIISVVVGGAVAIVDLLFPNKFSTILEVNYDMPYRYLVSHQDSSVQKRQCSQANSSASAGTSSTNTSTRKEAYENGAYETDSHDEDYSTIVNGKRAVSLRNFGKFAQKEGLKKNPLASFVLQNKRIHSFTTDAYQPSTSKHVNIDISAAALW